MTIHEKAIRLIEGGQVSVDGHCVKIKKMEPNFLVCTECEMDSICRRDSEMCNVCLECCNITRTNVILELVTNDNLMKQ